MSIRSAVCPIPCSCPSTRADEPPGITLSTTCSPRTKHRLPEQWRQGPGDQRVETILIVTLIRATSTVRHRCYCTPRHFGTPASGSDGRFPDAMVSNATVTLEKLGVADSYHSADGIDGHPCVLNVVGAFCRKYRKGTPVTHQMVQHLRNGLLSHLPGRVVVALTSHPRAD